MGQDLARVLDHRGEQPVLDRRQVDLLPADEDPALARVDLEVADGKDGLARLADGALGVPEGHAKPGEQLADAERLGDVVVGAGVERRDLVGLLAARREHDDRHRRPFAQPPDHLEPVEVGQAEVQDDRRRAVATRPRGVRPSPVAASNNR